MVVTEELINQVWSKGRAVDGVDSSAFRKDACGAWISKDKYGASDNDFGWEIDHIVPVSRLSALGIPDDMINDICNLRPLHCKNNASKGADYPSYVSEVTSEENINVQEKETRIVNKDIRLKLEKFFNIES